MMVRKYNVAFMDMDVPTVTITVRVTVDCIQQADTEEGEAERLARRVLAGPMFGLDIKRLTRMTVTDVPE